MSSTVRQVLGLNNEWSGAGAEGAGARVLVCQWPWKPKTLLMTTCIRQGSALRVSPADFISLFSERGEEREKERKRNIDMREKHQSVASHTPN